MSVVEVFNIFKVCPTIIQTLHEKVKKNFIIKSIVNHTCI